MKEMPWQVTYEPTGDCTIHAEEIDVGEVRYGPVHEERADAVREMTDYNDRHRNCCDRPARLLEINRED